MKTLYVQSLVTTIEECKGEARAERLEFCISLLEAALDAGTLSVDTEMQKNAGDVLITVCRPQNRGEG